VPKKKKGWMKKFLEKLGIGNRAPRPKHERTGEYAQEGSYTRTKGRFLKGTNVDITIGKIRERNAAMWKESNAK
jgi:hypothetical protein